jgi:thiamine biosynthesis lipoprotein ApbE
MKRLVSVFSLISLACVIAFLGCTSKNRELNHKLNEMATNLNGSTPVMLDRFTRFDSASVTKDNEFCYYYTILNTTNADSLFSELKQTISENIRSQVASSPDLRIFRDNDVTLRYFYRDSLQNIVHDITVTPAQYK